MKIVATADTHYPFDASMIPNGDVFILAGDIWVKWFKAGDMRVWRLAVNIPEGFTPPEPW